MAAPSPSKRLRFPGALRFASAVVLILASPCVRAHDTGHDHPHDPGPASVPLPLKASSKGPLHRPAPGTAGSARTGQGFWSFEAATNHVLPLPPATLPHLRGAHGTLIVDTRNDVVFWGLENVGWVAFSNRLSQSWVIQGDPALTRGNLHGADLLQRRGKLPLVVVADNVEGEVYLSDTTFQRATKLDWPAGGPYAAKSEFHPTDVAFVGPKTIYATDGYGQAWFMPADTEPLAYRDQFFGGKDASQTPHGITYDPRDRSLLISARPEGQIKRWSVRDARWLETRGLPPGSTVCDVDLWGDYALAPCLDGPGGSPGPIYVLDLKERLIRSVLRPKEDLGFTEAHHIHDAAWYVVKQDGRTEVYALFTYWNPGGIGALRLVR